ncbi:MAG: DUF4249 family protein [Bacteroidales bacterium]|nr:DUF4249 family protein [Bacteroidales bacterium]
MKVKYLYSIGILIVLLQGCEKEYAWNFQSDELNLIIVDGIITNEKKSQEIFLSQTNTGLNDSLKPLSGAQVRVSDGQHLYLFTESAYRPGWYCSDTFRAVINYSYHLEVFYEGVILTADAVTSAVTPLGGYEIRHDTLTGLNRFLLRDSSESASFTEVYYDWSVDSVFLGEYGSGQAKETFYRIPRTDVNAVFAPRKQVINFPGGTRLIRKKYSMTDDHLEFVRSLLMETEWSGGLFDVQHGNLSTNISEGGLGYFAVCMVVSDTLLVE